MFFYLQNPPSSNLIYERFGNTDRIHTYAQPFKSRNNYHTTHGQRFRKTIVLKFIYLEFL